MLIGLVMQALVFLAFSTAYGYVVQFKIFSLSVGFGLFHGLIFLPVVLAILGGDKVTSNVDKMPNRRSANVGKA